MTFDAGPVSFIICKLPEKLPEDILAKFDSKSGYSMETVLDEPQIGWVSGRHLLDTRIDESTAYPGGFLHLVLRSAVRKIPPSLMKAECRMEELAYMHDNRSLTLNRKQKRDIRDDITERLLKDMPPSLSGVAFVVDPTSDILYLATTAQSKIDHFISFFSDTVGFELIPFTAESIVQDILKIDLEALPGLQFAPGRTVAVESMIGRDFLTWLWYFQEKEGGTFYVDRLGEFGLMIDGPLFFIGEGAGAQEIVLRKGLPTISPEAGSALVTGKKLKKAKFVLARNDEMWVFTLEADNFSFASMRLPIVHGLDPISQFQDRIRLLGIFRQAFVSLFEKFVAQLADPRKFSRLSEDVKRWAAKLQKPIADS